MHTHVLIQYSHSYAYATHNAQQNKFRASLLFFFFYSLRRVVAAAAAVMAAAAAATAVALPFFIFFFSFRTSHILCSIRIY